MRVSLINANLVGPDAIGQCILQQARYSLRRGDQVQIYTPNLPYRVPDDLMALTRVVTPIELTTRHDVHFAQSDLYVYHYPSRHPLMESMLTLDRGAVIFYYHNVTPPELWGSDFERETLERSVAGASTLTAYADLIVTDSEFNADQLVRDHGVDRDRIRVLPLAVPLDRFVPGTKDDTLLRKYSLQGKRVIEFVGRMAGNKRIDLLVEALAIVRQSVPNAVLFLVGDNAQNPASNPAIAETVAKARARAQELGVTSHVIFTGVVDDQAPYYRLADVYASASLHEGFGVPLIEAMASGVPIVASNATAHPWVIGEAGLLAEPDNAADLAQQIVKVLTDDQLHGELVQRGLARARDFSLEQYETGWNKIVAEAAAWLHEQAQPPRRSISSALPQRAAAVKQAQANELTWLEKSADVMQRGYVVRSNAPLVGPLLAWLRRNLTSHLREPYLDPTLERQVAFNREVVRTLQDHAAQIARQFEEDKAERKKIAVQMEQLTAAVDQALETLALSGTSTAEKQQALQALRQKIKSDSAAHHGSVRVRKTG
jgi:glycosyltransferase involved in cell wall biosynthesis